MVSLAGPSIRKVSAVLALLLAVAAGAAQAREACPRAVIPCCSFAGADAAVPGRPGLGLQVWMADLETNAAALARAIRPAAIRYSAGPSWARLPPLAPDADDAALDRFVEAAFAADAAAPTHAARVAAFAEATGAEMHLVIWEPPRTLGEPDGPGRRLRPEALAVTARFYVAALAAYRARGFRVDVVELGNEPDGSWNMAVAPDLYAALLAEVRSVAARRKVVLPAIAGPGSSTVGVLLDWLADAGTAGRILAQLDRVSVHVWDDRKGQDPVALAARLRLRLSDLGWTGPVMATEAAWTFPAAADRERRTGANTRGPLAAGNRPDQAAASLRLLLALLASRFGPVVYWEYRDQPWGKASYGLLDDAGRPRLLAGPFASLAALLAPLKAPDLRADASGRVFLLRDGTVPVAVIVANPTADPFALRLDRTLPDVPLAPAGLQPCDGAGARALAVPAEAAGIVPLR